MACYNYWGNHEEYNLTLCPLEAKFWRPLVAYSNNLDPDEALQNICPDLRAKLFDTQMRVSAIFGWKQ